MHTRPQNVLHEAFIRGLVWAVVGLLYGAIFVAMRAFFGHWEGGGALHTVAAAALAGAVGALFYGSLRLAFLASVSSLIAAFGYLFLNATREIVPVEMMAVAGFAGVMVGGYYGFLMKQSRVCQATAKALAGLLAGCCAGLCLVVTVSALGPLTMALSAGILTAATGFVYILIVRRFIRWFHGRPSPLLSGVLVGGGVAALIGIAVWAFAGILSSTITGYATESVRYALKQLPQAALGGGAGGFLAGMALTFMGIRPLDR